MPAWQDGELDLDPRPSRLVHGIPEPDRLASAAAVDRSYRRRWASRATTSGRGTTSPPAGSACFFPTDLGIAEDEATGAAAVLLGAALGRDLTIRQAGSEIHVRARDDGSVDVGGRVELIEHRSYGERR